MNIAYIPLLLGIILNASAQLLLKTGMGKIGYFTFSVKNIWPIGLAVATNPYILMGLCCYVISVVVWLLGLSRIDVSIAYPLLSLAYVAVAIIAYFFLHEQVTFMRMAGIFVILIGVFIVARS
jgi:drug/metabolite transporter (DMT)-like permease